MDSKTIFYTSEERCLYCNEIIPEGRMICPVCEEKLISAKQEKRNEKHITKPFSKRLMNILWFSIYLCRPFFL